MAKVFAVIRRPPSVDENGSTALPGGRLDIFFSLTLIILGSERAFERGSDREPCVCKLRT
jgi:hypothetical protein